MFKTNFKKILLPFFIIFNTSVYADDHRLGLIWELTGLDNPESVVYNPQLNHLYVSNINGSPDGKDGNGYISIVSLDGKMIQQEWISGLNAPKGLAVYGETLYAADIDNLVEIDINNGQIKKYPLTDAKFLNDVTVDDVGNVYVSDMVLNRIYILSDGKSSIWIETDELENPNGLHFTEDDIIVGSWGKMTDGFATDVPGHLKRISLKTQSIKPVGDGTAIGNLDGVEGDDELGFFVTDWMNGGLFHITAKGNVSKLLDFEQGSADLEYIISKDMLYIPQMKENKLMAYQIK